MPGWEGPRHSGVGVGGIRSQRALHQLQCRDAIDQRVMKLDVHSEPSIGKTLHQMRLPLGTVPVKQAAVQARTQPSSGRKGTYSPKGTSRVFGYEPSDPLGPMRLDDL